MKRFLLIINCFFILLCVTQATAQIIDGDSSTFEYGHVNFYDDITGRTWLDLDQTFLPATPPSYQQTVDYLISNPTLAGYTMASIGDVLELYDNRGNLPGAQFWYYVQGGTYIPYVDTFSGGVVYAPELADGSSDYNMVWMDQLVGDVSAPSQMLDNYYSTATPTRGVGVWAYKETIQGNQVPEPTTMLLFSFGLLGLTGINRKKS